MIKIKIKQKHNFFLSNIFLLSLLVSFLQHTLTLNQKIHPKSGLLPPSPTFVAAVRRSLVVRAVVSASFQLVAAVSRPTVAAAVSLGFRRCWVLFTGCRRCCLVIFVASAGSSSSLQLLLRRTPLLSPAASIVFRSGVNALVHRCTCRRRVRIDGFGA
ncbi:hypothetical protein RIF29_15454 [Crotalaria pallida]|uniref:Transmembrane protein n=1 Tax=Crotalaria pallida TaxID=3830 RepID=A0AAN9FF44_CROPI